MTVTVRPLHTFRDSLDFLYARNQFAMKLGLENIRALLDRLGAPDQGGVFLHVAGTNGKGSVCANLAAMLRATGHRRVGLYTSPHLVSFRERIVVDDEPIPADYITRWMGKAQGHILELNATYFECVTALALDYFRDRNCEAVVLETGLGGRLDATNAVLPAITAVTSISLDHTAILGDTVEQIWREKIAIMKPGVPMVVCESRPHLLAELREQARALGSSVLALGDYPADGDGLGNLQVTGAFGRYTFPADLRSEAHQVENLRLSILTLEAFLARTRPGSDLPDGATLTPYLRDARLPGRTQALVEPGRLPLILDGAHNPGGMEALAAYLRTAYPNHRVTALFSIMRDKDFLDVFRRVKGFADEILFVPLGQKFPRALAYGELSAALAPAEREGLSEFPLSALALDGLTRADGDSSGRLLVACGSLYLLGELIPELLPCYGGLARFRQFAGES